MPRARQAIFVDIHDRHGWASGSESVSGFGSSTEQTRHLIGPLAQLIADLKVRTLVDAPCGDLNWVRHVSMPTVEHYIGVDIVPALIGRMEQEFGGPQRPGQPRRSFVHRDIVAEDLPTADLVLCRDALVHMADEDIWAFVRRVKRTSTWLLATSFGPQRTNVPIETGGWRPMCLFNPPFRFPLPTRSILEGCTEAAPLYIDKCLALWRTDRLPESG